MKKINSYNLSAKSQTPIAAPKEWAEANLPLLAQAIRVYEDRSHKGTKSAKTRAEVDITKKKVYKQKGTGGARHGAASAPIFMGGGVAHGPKPGKRELLLPKAMKIRALASSLSLKLKEDAVIAVSGLDKVKKTRDIASFVTKIKKDLAKNPLRTLVVSKTTNKDLHTSIRNIEGVYLLELKNLNARDIMRAGLIVLDDAIFAKKAATKATKVKKEKKS